MNMKKTSKAYTDYPGLQKLDKTCKHEGEFYRITSEEVICKMCGKNFRDYDSEANKK